MKNIALIIPGFNNAESVERLNSIYEKLSEKYEIEIFSFDGEVPEKYLKNTTSFDIADGNGGFFGKYISLIKKVFALRRASKEKNIKFLFSLSEKTNLQVLYSFLPVKKAIVYDSEAEFCGNIKKITSAFCKSDAILLSSELLKNKFDERFPAFSERTYVIHHPVNLELAEENAKVPLEEEYSKFFREHKVISVAGPFVKEKCQSDILKSFEYLKKTFHDVGLVFLGGGGPLRDEIHAMAQKSKYAVDILFIENNENYQRYLAASSVFVQASLEETTGKGIMEAMELKVPVVATDSGAFSTELLINEYNPEYKCDNMTFADNGVLVPHFDGEPDFDYNIINEHHIDLSNAIKALLHSKIIADETVKRAYKSLENYSTDKTLRRYVEFVDKLYLCL